MSIAFKNGIFYTCFNVCLYPIGKKAMRNSKESLFSVFAIVFPFLNAKRMQSAKHFSRMLKKQEKKIKISIGKQKIHLMKHWYSFLSDTQMVFKRSDTKFDIIQTYSYSHSSHSILFLPQFRKMLFCYQFHSVDDGEWVDCYQYIALVLF